MRSPLVRALPALLLFLLLFLLVAVWKLSAPVALRAPVLEIEIPSGSSMRQVARQVAEAGVDVEPWTLVVLARLTGSAHQVKAGRYQIRAGLTTWQLFKKLIREDAAQGEFVLIEGWNFRRLRAELARDPDLAHDSASLSDRQLLERIGAVEVEPEGFFLPEAYFFTKGDSELELLARAHRAMVAKLDQAWAAREAGLAISSSYEALILASLVEKETGAQEDRPRVASVFYNRLKIGMPLQTDPTVIYGMGENFSGKLSRADLKTDSPYNTYLRRGLPPTPIAMPGMASLHAVLNPPHTDYLYFVARGDGTSEFSRSLDEHNRAVARYQRHEP
ncbi:endolytic transglycosylase MltG [Niveibacterium terrae]|uniref:endolytic transglycosylase MltG n=1 Tax=Niveibacterium terrae TaxID=3373598 RepID=UPI003A8EF222